MEDYCCGLLLMVFAEERLIRGLDLTHGRVQ